MDLYSNFTNHIWSHLDTYKSVESYQDIYLPVSVFLEDCNTQAEVVTEIVTNRINHFFSMMIDFTNKDLETTQEMISQLKTIMS